MDNRKLPIRDYVLSQYEINIAQLQCDYGLSFIETQKIIRKMLSDADIIYKSDFTYTVLPNNKQKMKQVNNNTEQFLHALWICIALDKVTARAIERNLLIEFAEAVRLIEQMEKCGYISRSPQRKILITADEYVYKFGRRSWINDQIGVDVYVDNDNIICANPGPDVKEKLAYAVSMHNIMFAVQEMPGYVQITDRGVVLEKCPLSRAKVNSILKKYNKFIVINNGEITISVKSFDYVLYGMMELYAAITAIENFSEDKSWVGE